MGLRPELVTDSTPKKDTEARFWVSVNFYFGKPYCLVVFSRLTERTKRTGVKIS